MNQLIFKPYFVQRGRGPHISDFAYASDANGDVFHSNIHVNTSGVCISDSEGHDRFAIHVRWNVEGYGYLFMPADNGGDFYQLPVGKSLSLNMNYELAKARVYRNRKRLASFRQNGWKPSRDLDALLNLSEQYFDDTMQREANPDRCAQFAQIALMYALHASERLEIEKWRWEVTQNGYRSDFLLGCDTRGYFQMDSEELFMELFTELFNYATITHYLKGDFVDFEAQEKKKQFAERDELLGKLLGKNITVEGRPLFWIHKWVTPDWLRKKEYSDLLLYLEDHIRSVLRHYGDRIGIWEVVNEMHDWANELQLNPDQMVEITKLACTVARDENPNIRTLINNCCPFAEYVQKGKWHEIKAKYPQRTPHQFTREIIDARVDFDIIGAQMYFTRRPLADNIRVLERYAQFGKKVQLAEVGSPSSGITQEFIDEDKGDFSIHPYEWRRHWDEELQGDWLEYIFTYAYSQPWIEAANWYDFVDPYGFLKTGGLLRSPKGEKKAAVDRLLKLKAEWRRLSNNAQRVEKGKR